MFKIEKMTMHSVDGEMFDYKFSSGINFIQGANGSGKSEFYYFIDYMFGASRDFSELKIYKDTLLKVSISVKIDGKQYLLTRTHNKEENYLKSSMNDKEKLLSLEEYRNKIQALISTKTENIKQLREFTNEKITYRTFTMFNFLGEKRQGLINDFLDKCSEVKYRVKLDSILNYIFNDNMELISETQTKITDLNKEIKKLEENQTEYEFIVKNINKSLSVLNTKHRYNGKNIVVVLEEVNKIKKLMNENDSISPKNTNLIKLEIEYNDISERIKKYDAKNKEYGGFKREDINRKTFLQSLESIIGENEDFRYLVEPIQKIIVDLDNSISFSDYLVNDETIRLLKRQQGFVKQDIEKLNSMFELYSIEDKQKAMLVIDQNLTTDLTSVLTSLANLKKKRNNLKEQLLKYQNEDDIKKMNLLSNSITDFYFSAEKDSKLVETDSKLNGFMIEYIKKGNILQPKVTAKKSDDENEGFKSENLYMGSMARHTLIQLCGYLGFLKLLITENKYPLIPILVVDQISKEFDNTNIKAVGSVLEKFYKEVNKSEFQMFIIDKKTPVDLNLKVDSFNQLDAKGRTGFNPFYFDNRSENE